MGRYSEFLNEAGIMSDLGHVTGDIKGVAKGIGNKISSVTKTAQKVAKTFKELNGKITDRKNENIFELINQLDVQISSTEPTNPKHKKAFEELYAFRDKHVPELQRDRKKNEKLVSYILEVVHKDQENDVKWWQKYYNDAKKHNEKTKMSGAQKECLEIAKKIDRKDESGRELFANIAKWVKDDTAGDTHTKALEQLENDIPNQKIGSPEYIKKFEEMLKLYNAIDDDGLKDQSRNIIEKLYAQEYEEYRDALDRAELSGDNQEREKNKDILTKLADAIYKFDPKSNTRKEILRYIASLQNPTKRKEYLAELKNKLAKLKMDAEASPEDLKRFEEIDKSEDKLSGVNATSPPAIEETNRLVELYKDDTIQNHKVKEKLHTLINDTYTRMATNYDAALTKALEENNAEDTNKWNNAYKELLDKVNAFDTKSDVKKLMNKQQQTRNDKVRNTKETPNSANAQSNETPQQELARLEAELPNLQAQADKAGSNAMNVGNQMNTDITDKLAKTQNRINELKNKLI